MFPNYHIWRDTILAIVEENHPSMVSKFINNENERVLCLHSVRIHGFTGIEVQIAKHWDQLLGIKFLNAFLELLDLILAFTICLHLFNDLLQVACSETAMSDYLSNLVGTQVRDKIQ